MRTLSEHFFNIRRKVARFIIPEIFWPKYIYIDGANIKLRGTPYFFGVKLGLKNGTYEAPERKLLQQLDLYGETVIEMGGSIGVLTSVLAHKVGPGGRIISIEASEKISEYSRSWLEKSEIISVITGFAFPVFSLKNEITVINFDESGTNLTGTLAYESSLNQSSGEKKNENIYDINRISCFFNITPTILVADIEGSEKILIEQKPELPSSIKFILIELHPSLYGESIMEQIIETIENEGFLIKSKDTDTYLFERFKH